MQGTVQEFTKNQNGRTKVKIDGGWYNVGNDCDLGPTSVMIGERIEFDASNKPWNGKDVWWLNKYAKIPGGEPKSNGAPSIHPYVAPTTAGGSLDEPLLRFISNCVGSAIEAKTITDPCDMEIWAQGAYAAYKAVMALASKP